MTETICKVFDLHCDTIAEIGRTLRGGDAEESEECSAGRESAAKESAGCAAEESGRCSAASVLRENTMMLDLVRMKRSGYLCQCFSLYTDLAPLKEKGISPYEHVTRLARFWDEAVSGNGGLIAKACSRGEICANAKAGKMSAVMTVEEGGVYEGKIENLYALYEKGVRISTLTWNYPNELGYPNPQPGCGETKEYEQHGLTDTGIEFIREMERLGILIDVSHLNDAGIRDVFAHTKAPVIASHSNARALCGHLRNLPDEFIRKIAERGGMIGINFYPAFLREGGAPAAEAEDLLRHINYIRKIAGIDCIALGSDFDGFAAKGGLSDCGMMQALAEELGHAGFHESEIERIFYKNALRVFGEVCRNR